MKKLTVRPLRTVVGIFVLVFHFSASAFQLGDHQTITEQAAREFKMCFPKLAGLLDVDVLVEADLDEDTNLVNKELFYSHFFHPEKKLRMMWRDDSSGRIASLNPELLQCHQSVAHFSVSALDSLGHAIHHFQDMAVPAHIIPVNHSLWDGFESYPVTGDISSGWTCAQVAAAAAKTDLQSILKETASATLKTVRDTRVEASVPTTKSLVQLSGTDFWQEAGDDGFGTYGVLGNHFGDSDLDAGADGLLVALDFYREFKRQQMKLAVRATLRGLAWTLAQ